MIGRIITRGRNSGLKCLSTGSLSPFPFPFLAIFPQTESLFTGYGVGGLRVAVWAKRQLTLQTTSGLGGGVHVPVTVWKLGVFNSHLHVWWRRLSLCYWYFNFFYSFPHFSPPKTPCICTSSTRGVQCLKKLYFSLSFGQTALTFCSSEATFCCF